MRSLEELINTTEPGWPLLQEWIGKAKNKIEVLPVDAERAAKALYNTQVTTRSPLGTVIYMTGGLLIDHGWIRILGSGSPRLGRSLPEWNYGKGFKTFGQTPPFLLIADDAVGGFYVMNGGEFGKRIGKIYYFAPDTLEYEPLDMTYTDFLMFCFNEDLSKFYEQHRWLNWKEEVSVMTGDQVFNFYPFLWTREGKNIEENSRKIIPVEEQYQLNLDLRSQIVPGQSRV